MDEIASFVAAEQPSSRVLSAELAPDPVQGLLLTFTDPQAIMPSCLKIVPVPMAVFDQTISSVSRVPVVMVPTQQPAVMYLYEDRWRSNPDYWRARLRVRWGKGERIFARNCLLIRPDAAHLRPFLDTCHTYGMTRSRYRYALADRQGNLLAVATFSAPRPMLRDGVAVESWEWIRYASLPHLTIVGGMSRLLEAFVREVDPQEIMTYADLEWSAGQAYAQLGFEEVDHRPCVEFCVDPADWSRHSVAKMQHDRRYRNDDRPWQQWPRILNLGSRKFLKRRW